MEFGPHLAAPGSDFAQSSQGDKMIQILDP